MVCAPTSSEGHCCLGRHAVFVIDLAYDCAHKFCHLLEACSIEHEREVLMCHAHADYVVATFSGQHSVAGAGLQI